MTTAKSDLQSPGRKPLCQPAVEVKVGSQDVAQAEPGQGEKVTTAMPRPLRIYTRLQILLLHNSPLVKPPSDMPELRYWFGSENEHGLGKKEAEPSTPSSARERRFRRDADDGETPSRPTFRSTLSQPSQMGNFKHQSLRASDRDRDRDRDKDGEKDRERDIRDKEGQERLRNLSDKYDRDRLALPSANLRNKERDTAPHLAAGSSSRLGAPTQAATVANRRADAREAAKKKAGETSEDWRRGPEPPRSTREERSDNGRKDRDDREQPRSRIRDASRVRRDPSISRRDRERERDDRETARDRRDRDRDDYRRERDDYRRDRDKDLDRELELDDPRRWRDDGKRDDRMAARRGDRQSDREHRDRERPRDRAPHEGGWDPSHDRRWTIVEERDGRSKRSTARDRKGLSEEGKDREDRKDREREKEKEPAWMDTYIPSASRAGILGGKGNDGELDGIQAWKKGMKEKEQRDKGTRHVKEGAEGDRPSPPEQLKAPEKQLDEIQLFKLLMKKEEEKKMTDKPNVIDQDDARPPLAPPPSDSSVPGLMRIRDQRKVPAPPTSDAKITPNPQAVKPGNIQPAREKATSQNSRLDLPAAAPSSNSEATPAAAVEGSRSLISILPSKNPSTHHTIPPTPALELSPDRPKTPPPPRFPPNPPPHENQTPAPQSTEKTSLDPLSVSISNQFNPPQSSRLLAFGARAPNAIAAKSQASADHPVTSPLPNGQPRLNGFQQTSSLQSIPPGTYQNSGMLQPEHSLNQGALKSESLHPLPGFSPFEDQSRSSVGFDEPREQNFIQPPDLLRRVSGERPPFTSTPESGVNPDPTPFDPSSGAGYAAGKGSRFAKFFDGKAREGQPAITKAQTPVGFASSSPILGQRQEQGGFSGVLGSNTDHRAMDDIFAMLNSSAQGQRVNPPNTTPTSSNVTFGQQTQNNLQLQQQQMQPQQGHHVPSNGRLEALYESRLDDRNFMPDGMVPGLRSAPPPRNRDSGGMFSESLDDPIHFNGQRLPPPQQRGLDPMYSGPVPSLYAQQASRNAGIPLQQPHYRGGPSPISSQNSLQRLPPGLANLGGRPPHEPSQFLGMPMPSAGLHGNVHGPPQQPFNNFAGAGNISYGGPQMRAPPPGPHLQNLVTHNPMGHPNNMDLRGPSQAQLLGMGGVGVNVGGGLRAVGGGFVHQQGQATPTQPPLLAMRQQQQQQPHLLPHMVPHLVPPHIQQQGRPGANNQPAHDLMALLMGGGPRE